MGALDITAAAIPSAVPTWRPLIAVLPGGDRDVQLQTVDNMWLVLLLLPQLPLPLLLLMMLQLPLPLQLLLLPLLPQQYRVSIHW